MVNVKENEIDQSSSNSVWGFLEKAWISHSRDTRMKRRIVGLSNIGVQLNYIQVILAATLLPSCISPFSFVPFFFVFLPQRLHSLLHHQWHWKVSFDSWAFSVFYTILTRSVPRSMHRSMAYVTKSLRCQSFENNFWPSRFLIISLPYPSLLEL